MRAPRFCLKKPDAFPAKASSLEETARQIFGPEDDASIERWVGYWRESRERNQRLLDSFEQLVLLDFKQKSVLDIGCGTGGLGELIADQCRLYVGGDYHGHVLQFTAPGRNRYYLQCSAPSLPFADQSFDYIFAFDVIEHLIGGRPWQLQFLRELRRVLRPLGLILFTTPNKLYPYEGHSQLYFPHYLPAALSDRYISLFNPGFLREHHSFSEIKILTPRALRGLIRESGLAFLHDLPCGLDRQEFLRESPVRGWMAYTGLAWIPHAEFWGILVGREHRSALRLKLKKNWRYEHNQPSASPPSDFGPCIDFRVATFSPQLGPGWHWYERESGGAGERGSELARPRPLSRPPLPEAPAGQPKPCAKAGSPALPLTASGAYRWTTKQAACYLESRSPVHYVCVYGYSPHDNWAEVWVNGIRVGEHEISGGSDFKLQYLIPFQDTAGHMFEVSVRCARAFQSDDPRDRRDLGLMIFSIGLSECLSD